MSSVNDRSRHAYHVWWLLEPRCKERIARQGRGYLRPRPQGLCYLRMGVHRGWALDVHSYSLPFSEARERGLRGQDFKQAKRSQYGPGLGQGDSVPPEAGCTVHVTGPVRIRTGRARATGVREGRAWPTTPHEVGPPEWAPRRPAAALACANWRARSSHAFVTKPSGVREGSMFLHSRGRW